MKHTLIDLFSGSGGVAQGFKNQGFEALAAVEWDPIAAQTFRKNHPKTLMYEEDIRKVDPVAMKKQLKLRKGNLTVLSACAPCQPFSRQNKRNKKLTRKKRIRKKDTRTGLILKVLPFVETFRPKFILMENFMKRKMPRYRSLIMAFYTEMVFLRGSVPIIAWYSN